MQLLAIQMKKPRNTFPAHTYIVYCFSPNVNNSNDLLIKSIVTEIAIPIYVLN